MEIEPLTDEPIAILRGPREVVAGYYDLEKHERNQQNVAIREHSDAVALWYRALTLYRRAILGDWTLTGGEPGSHELAAEGLPVCSCWAWPPAP